MAQILQLSLDAVGKHSTGIASDCMRSSPASRCHCQQQGNAQYFEQHKFITQWQDLNQMSLQVILAQVAALRNAAKAKQVARFFKTGPGEYGEGDVFAGLTNPECRKIATTNKTASFQDVEQLLASKVHEERLIGLLVLQHKAKKAELEEEACQLYLRNLKSVNNWDLVDLSAPQILGNYIYKRCSSFKELTGDKDPRKILYNLVGSASIWQRRISILTTYTFIRKGECYDTLLLSSQLLKDRQDLIHKAVGWMLRQVGKKELHLLQNFIQQHYEDMPRTTLRYAIEKFPEPKRKGYLKGQW